MKHTVEDRPKIKMSDMRFVPDLVVSIDPDNDIAVTDPGGREPDILNLTAEEAYVLGEALQRQALNAGYQPRATPRATPRVKR
jgi:hypothetical protein